MIDTRIIISHKYKWVWVPQAKVASSTFIKLLSGVPWGLVEAGNDNGVEIFRHRSRERWEDYINAHDDYFKFSCVRNPWSRLVSFYFCRGTRNHPAALRFRSDFGIEPNIPFNEFVKLILTKGITHGQDYHYEPQYNALYNSNDELLVDYVGRFENLQEDIDTICDKIGIPQQQLPHKNKTKHKHYTEYYDDETRQIVAERYAKDIEYFGYEFEK